MPEKRPLIVITDLDGTLLDHHNYQYTAALPALQLLKKRNIPLVLSSSKTAAEIESLRTRLDNRHPYVVENGAGIYVPGTHGLKKICFGIERKQVLDVIHALRLNEDAKFIGFADLSAAEVEALTGLTKTESILALQRDFTEPIQWQSDESSLGRFKDTLEAQGLSAIQGGRFLSISGKVDKGQALNWLREYYVKQYKAAPVMIALGDSDNDRPMLENADYAIVVRSPVHKAPLVNNNNVIVTETTGPNGWNDSLLSLLETFK